MFTKIRQNYVSTVGCCPPIKLINQRSMTFPLPTVAAYHWDRKLISVFVHQFFGQENAVELLRSPYYKGVPLLRIPSVCKLGMKSRIAKQTVHLSVEPQGMYSYAGPTDARPQRQYEYALGLKLIALSKIGTQGLEIRLYLCQRCTQKISTPFTPPAPATLNRVTGHLAMYAAR